MAWISSEYFYRRLMRSQMLITEQLEHQEPATSEAMQKEFEAIVDERDELRKWKEAHRYDRKDSATCEHSEECKKSQEEIRDLKSHVTASRSECTRLQTENEELLSSLQSMKEECREAGSLRKSFNDLEAAHEKLKSFNVGLEQHLAVLQRDLEFQKQACKELGRSRDDLQDEVDEKKVDLLAQKKTISNLVQESISKDDHIKDISSKLELASKDVRALTQSRKLLESQLDAANGGILLQTNRAAEHERNFNDLQTDYELVCTQVQRLKEAISALELLNKKKPEKDWDQFLENCMLAVLVLLIALGLYGTWTGKLT